MKSCLQASCGLELDTVGRVRACCLADPFVDENGNEYNLSTNSLEEIWNSPSRKKLLDDLQNGIENPTCKICWVEEKHGRESKRQRENQRDLVIKDTPQVLDLKLGNTCNLRCRTCNPDSSSSWVTEWYDVYHTTNTPKSEFLQKYKRIRDLYSSTNESLWKTLEEWIPKCILIDFYGGEPLLIERSWDILRKCVADGYSNQQELHFNTNATIFLSDQQIETLKNFKQVNISLSIDGIKEKFEYMRYPAKWDIVAENIRKYSDLSEQHDHIRVDFCYTVSIMNVWDIIEFDSFVQTNYPTLGIYYNMLFTPKHFSITVIPETIKSIVSQRLLEYSPRMREITNMLFQETHDPIKFKKLFTILDMHDTYRKNYFKESFPEWHSVLVE